MTKITVPSPIVPNHARARRPQAVRRLGVRLHPTEVADAWYTQDCPPVLDLSALSRRVRAQWVISRWLRGVKRHGR